MAAISVIVPVYKVETYLHRCVDSILNQSFRDFELILVDDGSPDNCGSICDDYAGQDHRIRVIHQENGGLSAARNAGLDWVFAHSKSTWLTFVDSDDWVSPEYLHLLYQAVLNTGCRISACGLFRTSGEGLPEALRQQPERLDAEAYYCSPYIHGGVTAVACSKLYHRSLFQNLRFPVGKLHEDELTTYLAVYQAGAVAVIQGQLYAYFQNPTGIMLSQWNPKRMHLLEAMEQQIAYAKQRGYPGLLRKASEQYVYCAYEQLNAAAALPEQRRFWGLLRRKLRRALALGRKHRAFPFSWDTLWAYERAYPMKPVWWLAQRIKAARSKGGS